VRSASAGLLGRRIPRASLFLARLLLLCAAVSGCAQTARTLSPPAPSQFAIMAWGKSPSDPGQLMLMQEVGLNISGFCAVSDLEAIHQAGLACFVDDKRVNGYDWARLPEEAELRSNIESVADAVRDRPAVMGFRLRDEPRAWQIPAMGRVASILREVLPDAWPYVTLYPNTVSTERLGAPTYDDYVRKLVEGIRQPFLNYDHYALHKGQLRDSFYTNLEIIRRLSQEMNKPFWNVILANAHFNYMDPSDATLHLQVYSTLAYGGRGIGYFTYGTPRIGNYRLGAIDWFGNRTPTWDMLRRINRQIHALAPTLLRLRSTGVYHHPSVPLQGRPLSESRLVAGVIMIQSPPVPSATAPFLVGEFEDEQGRPYLLLVNRDLGNSVRFALNLKQPGGKLFRVSPYSGVEEFLGREMDWLAPGAGILLRID